LCRKSANELASVKPDLDSLGIGLVAIGSGTPLMAKGFQSEFNFPGDIYVDQKREIYKALGCNRGLKYVLNPKVLKAAKATLNEGYTQGKTEGDALQLGGVFIISPKNGILFQHLEQYAGHHVDLTELMNACKLVTSGNLDLSSSSSSWQ